MLKKIAPAAKIKRMINSRMGVKRTALSMVDAAAETEVGVLDKKAVAEVALKTVRGYQQRVEAAKTAELVGQLLDDPKQLIQRVQNEIVFQVYEKIKTQYKGERARWLPSDSEEPRPEHQKNYGKVYVIGEGIDGVEPGDEFGCKCGVEILTKETQLELE